VAVAVVAAAVAAVVAAAEAAEAAVVAAVVAAAEAAEAAAVAGAAAVAAAVAEVAAAVAEAVVEEEEAVAVGRFLRCPEFPHCHYCCCRGFRCLSSKDRLVGRRGYPRPRSSAPRPLACLWHSPSSCWTRGRFHRR